MALSQRTVFFSCSWLALLLCICVGRSSAQEANACMANQIHNGRECVCAPGYFDKGSKERCEDECEEEYFSYFTYGACVNGLFGRSKDKDKQSPCNMKCGMRVQIWATVAIFVVIAAAIVTLVLLLPMCVTNCMSCIHSKKASKHSKRVAIESQQPNKDQQLQTLSYNPYSYWPYYGR